jgi:hypothetical protein
MEASKRERYLLLGAVPILAAGFGSVVTLLGQHYLGDGSPDPTILEIIKMQGLTPEQRIQLLEYATKSSSSFYSLLHIALGLFSAPLAAILWALARKIQNG